MRDLRRWQHHARLRDGRVGPEWGSAYRCDKLSHCSTPAIPADQAMAKVMIARLSQPDIADLLPAPEPRPEVDVKALRAEARKLHAKRDDLARLLSEDVLTEAGVRQERKRIDARLAEISTELADATQIDLLPELRSPEPTRPASGRACHYRVSGKSSGCCARWPCCPAGCGSHSTLSCKCGSSGASQRGGRLISRPVRNRFVSFVSSRYISRPRPPGHYYEEGR